MIFAGAFNYFSMNAAMRSNPDTEVHRLVPIGTNLGSFFLVAVGAYLCLRVSLP